MKKINYRFWDGHYEEIEVTDEVAELQISLEHDDQREIWRQKKRKDKSIDYLESLGIEFSDQTRSAEEDYILKKEIQNLHLAIEKLEPQQKDLIIQIFFEGKTQAEIAKRDGVGESAIRSRLNKIYIKLRKYLEKDN